MLRPMRPYWQAMMILAFGLPFGMAKEPEQAIAWQPLAVKISAFSADLGLLDAERESYATSLASCAAIGIREANASQEALDLGQRLLAVALNLSPHNRLAKQVNQQLAQGELPDALRAEYGAPSLARLLLARGNLLVKSQSQEDRLLGRMFFRLAADLDPKNDAAGAASKADQLDFGNVDWTFLTRRRTGNPPPPPLPDPAKLP